MKNVIYSNDTIKSCWLFASLMKEINKLYVAHNCPDVLPKEIDDANPFLLVGHNRNPGSNRYLDSLIESVFDFDEEFLIKVANEIEKQHDMLYHGLNMFDDGSQTYKHETAQFSMFRNEALEMLENYKTFSYDEILLNFMEQNYTELLSSD